MSSEDDKLMEASLREATSNMLVSDGVASTHPVKFYELEEGPEQKAINSSRTLELLQENEGGFYYRLPKDSTKVTAWLKKLNQAVWPYLVPEIEQVLPELTKILLFEDFPKNYSLYLHVTQKKEQLNTVKFRTDAYLFGHPQNKKFRSPNEFLPHFLWLLAGSTESGSECICQYCSRSKSRTPKRSATKTLSSKVKKHKVTQFTLECE
ncbi:hypothetical protein K493DRAFT_357605 [Basidiobolus meristosporus CBS 931.73]|uniref:Cryptic loci regulator 2 N-terminal domain-containing protein n=1 Tax=Basidiobolus meristosporus CBS 931.73 TaxID=1314790 RepID=A0A1Y1XVS0_9FUNG|nr:hypothetical protein K493DRAFT_357605 [Basidiobolus meristosporus CBS 931.73]|eukprot:ORX89850.1 hypothetical protein K493DRAFT_357605 [Basidiobolus meristosporus CBS 931.73]